MLGKVASDKEDETVKKIKIGDLPAVRFHYYVHTLYQTHVLEEGDGTPRAGFTTSWFRTNKGYFRINLAIVGPKVKKPKGEFPVYSGKPQNMLKEITDLVTAFNIETLGEDAES